jgi:hypothetical protein
LCKSFFPSCLVSFTQSAQHLSLGAPSDDEPLVVPEDIGTVAAQLLLEEVSRGGVVDGSHQGILLTLAALGPEEINQVGATELCFSSHTFSGA